MKRVRVFISGLVQGVGFRHFVERKAEGLGLVGWVRNLPDGRVEAVFEGSKERIQEMISLCRKGPFGARVQNINVEWEEATGKFKTFETR